MYATFIVNKSYLKSSTYYKHHFEYETIPRLLLKENLKYLRQNKTEKPFTH